MEGQHPFFDDSFNVLSIFIVKHIGMEMILLCEPRILEYSLSFNPFNDFQWLFSISSAEFDGFGKEWLELKTGKLDDTVLACNSLRIEISRGTELVRLVKDIENSHCRVLRLMDGLKWTFRGVGNWGR